ncbi:MAG: hypothetical protein DLM50_04445 [Candidatus Meridianibacter frigidus]|nr:MAG: hypothetical protein DLM50_04445 [Candidatus Eremiobacteraeota bacterium]
MKRAMLLFGCALAACSPQSPHLEAVSGLPAPGLPAQITDYSPKSAATTLAQIRIIFKNPLIALERLESADEAAKLASFHIAPAVPGHFRFLTPRMVGFQADRALPKATRIRISVDAGLADVANSRLDREFAWTFRTEALHFANLPGNDDAYNDSGPVDVNPALKFTANVAADPDSLGSHVTFVPKDSSHSSVGATAQLDKDATPAPGSGAAESFDPSLRSFVYTIKPTQALDHGVTYRVAVASGVQPSEGNLPSERAYSGTIQTYGPLQFTGLQTTGAPDSTGNSGRFVNGAPQLTFNNGLDAASAQGAITVAPQVSDPSRLFSLSDGDQTVTLNPFQLSPNHSYTVTVATTLKDKFGQSLGSAKSATFTTGDLAPDFWSPSGTNIFASSNNIALEYSAVNLPNSRYQAAYRRLNPQELAAIDTDYADTSALVPAASSWPGIPVRLAHNQVGSIAVPVRAQLGASAGVLAYGVQARTNAYTDENGKARVRTAQYFGTVQLTNLGVNAQWFPQNAAVAVQRLSDGAPVSGATVDVFRAKSATPCASRRTSADGFAELSGLDIQRCSAGSAQGPDIAPTLLVVARTAGDWAYTRLSDDSGYGYGLYLGWSNGKPESRGTIFSDRQLYQPGESVALTAVAYYLQNGALKADRNASYHVTLKDANGMATDLGMQKADAFGFFPIRLTLKKNQPLGDYTVAATGSGGNTISGYFRVAEFKPPNFKVVLSLDHHTATSGQDIRAQAKSSYLFGSTLAGANVRFTVTRSQVALTPQGWDAFQFGRQWFWPEEAPAVPADVLQHTATLDQNGNATQDIPVAADLPFPMSYQVSAEVTDQSNLSVADTQTFTATPGDAVIGLKNDFVGGAGEPVPVGVIVTDPTGKVQSGRPVHLELQSMDFGSATQIIEGGENARNSVKYTTVDSRNLTSAATAQTAALKASKAGVYRIRATFADIKNDADETDTQIWIAGPQPVGWGSQNKDQLNVELDKTRYRTGDRATVLVQSPYPQADLYLSVVRERTLYKTLLHVIGGAPRASFRITKEMLPNAAVHAILVRRGKPLGKVAPGALDSLVRIGLVGFNVNLDDKYLKVGITPLHARLQPGDEQTVRLSVRDSKDHPVSGRLVVMVVNDAILQLTGYRLPDLVKTVYADQPISVRISDNRPKVVLSRLASPIAKGFGFGGGFMQGAGSTRVRTQFLPLAYYNGTLSADSVGNASVQFKLPDDVTTWRVMAVAAGSSGDDFHFGTADDTFVSTKPLLANPLLPQFARSGDRFQGGVALTNTTGRAGAGSIDGALGGALQFDQNGERNTLQSSQTIGSGSSAYRYPMIALSNGNAATVRFGTRLDAFSDAFSLPFELRNTGISETVALSGATDGSASLPVQGISSGDALELWLGSSVMPQIVAPARRAFQEETGDFLEPAASRMMIAAALKSLSALYGQMVKADLGAEIRSDHAVIRKLQQPDGGIAGWPNGKSDPILSAYAGLALARASAAGFPDDAAVRSHLKTYLQATLQNPARNLWCSSQDCKATLRLNALMALAELGEVRSEHVADIYAARDHFGISWQARLARYLLALPAWQSQGAALAKSLQQDLYLTARNAAVNEPYEIAWFDSKSAAQAQMLRLLVAAHAPADLTDNVVRTLGVDHCACSFADTYDAAQRVTALADYARSQPRNPNFTASATAGSTILAQGKFTGYRDPSKRFMLTGSALQKNPTLKLQKTGTGTLRYSLVYSYKLPVDAPGMLNGLRVTRMVRAANEAPVLVTAGLSHAAGATLSAGAVYDVEIELIADHPVDHVLITDPLPSGLEAVDSAFATSVPTVQTPGDSWEIDYQTIYKDRIVAFADHLGAGLYQFHYLVRSVTPGRFRWPGAEAHLQYAPEEFARTAASLLTITQ